MSFSFSFPWGQVGVVGIRRGVLINFRTTVVTFPLVWGGQSILMWLEECLWIFLGECFINFNLCTDHLGILLKWFSRSQMGLILHFQQAPRCCWYPCYVGHTLNSKALGEKKVWLLLHFCLMTWITKPWALRVTCWCPASPQKLCCPGPLSFERFHMIKWVWNPLFYSSAWKQKQ